MRSSAWLVLQAGVVVSWAVEWWSEHMYNMPLCVYIHNNVCVHAISQIRQTDWDDKMCRLCLDVLSTLVYILPLSVTDHSTCFSYATTACWHWRTGVALNLTWTLTSAQRAQWKGESNLEHTDAYRSIHFIFKKLLFNLHYVYCCILLHSIGG